jgi:hypothetical protein
MKRLNKELAITMSGAKSESIVSKTLEHLDRPNTKVYRNVYVTDGKEETELDAVVLTDSEIIILEVKTIKSDITLTEDGRMVFARDECYDKIPLGEKMAIKRRLLKKALENAVAEANLNIPIYVDSYIVFSVPKGQYIQIDDRYHKEKYCFRTSLNKKIEKHFGPAYYKNEHLDQLDTIFTAMESNAKRFEPEINFDDVRHSLANAMVVMQNSKQEQKIATEPKVVAAPTNIVKVIEPKIVRDKIAQQPKKTYGLEYIAAGILGSALGLAMVLGLGLKRAE